MLTNFELKVSNVSKPSVVLAYSGGLDTSVLVGWLQDKGYDVHCLYVDVGQPGEDREAMIKKALDIGAASAEIADVREEMVRDFAFPCVQWQARYENIYLLGTSIARPIIAKACLQKAREVGAVAFVHGATGKGNDQCRFQMAAEALDPSVTTMAPWRMDEFREKFPGRKEMLEYCEEKNIPVKASKAKPYSSDENALHISYEAGDLEDLTVDGQTVVDFGMGVSPQEAPDEETKIVVGFESGVPVTVDGEKFDAFPLLDKLNNIGGANGIGRIDIVENRFVGMKSRGVYESPGMTILYAAHQALEQVTLDRDLQHLRDRMSPEVAEMVYYGWWYCAKMDAMLAFIKEAQQPVTGEITLALYKGNIRICSRTSPCSLYDEEIASMEGSVRKEGAAGDDYSQNDAEGFLRITGVPLRVQGKVRPREW